MNSQLNAPKKPFPIAGVFLLIHALALVCCGIAGIIQYIFLWKQYYWVTDNSFIISPDFITEVLKQSASFLFIIPIAVLALILLIKRSGLGLAIMTAVYTASCVISSFTSIINSVQSIPHLIKYFIEYTEWQSLLNAISNLTTSFASLLTSFALIIITIIAFVSVKPERSNSFIIKVWWIPLVIFILAFLMSGTNYLIEIIRFAVFSYSFNIANVLMLLASSFASLTALLAHGFLAIWFGCLALYRRKLAKYEAAMPIESTASAVTEAPAPAVEPSPVISETEPVAESAGTVESVQPVTASEPEVTPAVIGEIQRLKQLLDTGAISDADFETLKNRLMN